MQRPTARCRISQCANLGSLPTTPRTRLTKGIALHHYHGKPVGTINLHNRSLLRTTTDQRCAVVSPGVRRSVR